MKTHATIIRDAIIARMLDLGFTTVRSNPAGTLQPHELPYLGVYVVPGGRSQPEGDGNTGGISFLEDAVIAFSIVEGGDPETIEYTLDNISHLIQERLFSDATFTAFDPPFWESIEEITRARPFAHEGETHFAEMRMHMTFRFRWDHYPTITDDFESLHIRAAYPTADATEEDRPQVVAEWDIPQT